MSAAKKICRIMQLARVRTRVASAQGAFGEGHEGASLAWIQASGRPRHGSVPAGPARAVRHGEAAPSASDSDARIALDAAVAAGKLGPRPDLDRQLSGDETATV